MPVKERDRETRTVLLCSRLRCLTNVNLSINGPKKLSRAQRGLIVSRRSKKGALIAELLTGDEGFAHTAPKLKQSPAAQALQPSSQNTSGGMITPAGPKACGVVAHRLLMLSYCGGPILLYWAAEAYALLTSAH
jgi:hypothetical protein